MNRAERQDWFLTTDFTDERRCLQPGLGPTKHTKGHETVSMLYFYRRERSGEAELGFLTTNGHELLHYRFAFTWFEANEARFSA